MVASVTMTSKKSIRVGDDINGVFVGVEFIGDGFKFDDLGNPIKGGFKTIIFHNSGVNNSAVGGSPTIIDRITFPTVTVASLNARGFDWLIDTPETAGQFFFDLSVFTSFRNGIKWDLGIDDRAAHGGSTNDILQSTSDVGGAATFYGHGGNDSLYSSAAEGGDYLSGDEGNDNLTVTDFQLGTTTLMGGAGNDRLTGSASAQHMEGGDGDDVINAGGNTTPNDEYVDGGAGNDKISGGFGDQFLFGGADNDKISGDDGNDQLFGDAGNDKVIGGNGNDTLSSGDGSDRLYGDAGDDQLFLNGNGDVRAWGGSGSDTFVFDVFAAQRSTVLDFKASEDILWIDNGVEMSQQEMFDYFVAHAQQVGKNVVFSESATDSLTLRGTDLDDLTLSNFHLFN